MLYKTTYIAILLIEKHNLMIAIMILIWIGVLLSALRIWPSEEDPTSITDCVYWIQKLIEAPVVPGR